MPSNPALTPEPLGDQLTIETPEQTSLEFAIAGIGSRFLAMAIDTLIQTIVAGTVILAIVYVDASLELSAPSGPWITAIAVLFLFVVYYGYFFSFESAWNGQTRESE